MRIETRGRIKSASYTALVAGRSIGVVQRPLTATDARNFREDVSSLSVRRSSTVVVVVTTCSAAVVSVVVAALWRRP